MMLTTTLAAIRKHEPCADGWAKLLHTLNKTTADDDLVTFADILDSNGIDDALWALRAVEGHDRELRLFAVWCARQVQHLMTDPRSLAALDVAERYAHGTATHAELAAARAAVLAAARAAAGAWDAAWAGVGAAAWDAAGAVAAVRAAAWAGAGAAARAAAWDGAGAAARAAQAAEFRRRFCQEEDA